MLNCAVCGTALTELESEFNGRPIHTCCLDRAIIESAMDRMRFIPLDMPEWMKDFFRRFATWKLNIYG